ncbi:4'-phosphopantetheinyl transferase superfamily protein [Streptomyces sp. NPDC051320]|uniref:4'-phosphopantetheinyl transferase family protein n=1 Tax=Streptomyces sp. NPDC051320 TaxID=3154644 RepID=UPI003419969C
MEHLLPSPVVTVESFGEPAVLPPLFPEEELLVVRAVHKRRAEFASVRACARTALGRLGVAPVPILRGPKGEPRWPDGIVGTMTHCDGFRAAAVARADEVVSIGMDAEPNEPMPGAGELLLVTLAEERAWLPALAAEYPEVCWERLVFSAKESVYKAWYPMTRRWLGFDEAAITVDPVAGTFSARLLVPGPLLDGRRPAGFEGRWAVRDGLIRTAVAVGL